jgi:hypothetical protein
LLDATISPDCLFALNAYHIYMWKTLFSSTFWIWLLGIIGNISLLQEIFLRDVLNLISLSC